MYVKLLQAFLSKTQPIGRGAPCLPTGSAPVNVTLRDCFSVKNKSLCFYTLKYNDKTRTRVKKTRCENQLTTFVRLFVRPSNLRLLWLF